RTFKPPLILGQPASRDVVAGDSTAFLVNAEGSKPLNYQWLYNGAPISDATNALFTISSVKATDAGWYSVFVSNVLGSVASQPAFLSVLPVPPCVTLPSGVVSWWPMQTGGEDVVSGHDLGLLGAPSSRQGRVGQALFLDGLTDEGDVAGESELNV